MNTVCINTTTATGIWNPKATPSDDPSDDTDDSDSGSDSGTDGGSGTDGDSDNGSNTDNGGQSAPEVMAPEVGAYLGNYLAAQSMFPA